MFLNLFSPKHYYYYYHFVFSQSNLINYLHILWLWIRLNRFYWRDTHHCDQNPDHRLAPSIHPASHKTWEFIKQIHRDRDQEDDNDTAGNKWLRAVYIVRRTEDQDHSLICSTAGWWWGDWRVRKFFYFVLHVVICQKSWGLGKHPERRKF